jgi:hypothetical protein
MAGMVLWEPGRLVLFSAPQQVAMAQSGVDVRPTTMDAG